MARTVTDLAKLLDAWSANPDDPVTAHGVGRAASYDARHGALRVRIGILRDDGHHAEPDSDDFKKVGEVFDRAVVDLAKAGAEIVDRSSFRSQGAAGGTRQKRRG
jgi:Asp-tRNA(Asn)/Glu-tRNA(Gln) amidotransferase A subunit family amidase